MIQKTVDIDAIVRDVLAELGLLSKIPESRPTSADPEPPSPDPQPTAAEPPPRPAGDVVLSDRVVTLGTVGDRLNGARRLVVPPRAIVTPAVRDELRRRNVTLVHEEPIAAGTAGGSVALTVLGSRIDPKPLVAELKRLGLNVDQQRFDCLVRANDDMARRLAARGTAGVMLSNYGAIALCLANRHDGVRAVLASDESRTAANAASVGANLVVVEPRRMSPETVQQVVVSFCRNGPGECPEELRDRLA